MRRAIIKEGPLVFLRNVIVMELVAAVFFYAISYLTNYEQLFNHLGLSNHLRYSVFIMIIFSAFETVYISALFLDWYFSYYEITDNDIIRKSGLLFRRRKSVRLSDVVSVETYQSPLSRVMNHATIILEHRNQRVTKIKNVSNADEYVDNIKRIIATSSGRVLFRDVSSLIEEGEGHLVEFKETLRYDARKGEVSKEMERMVLKTIVAFLNSAGGTLLIGVNDEGVAVGLERDFKALPKKSRDGFENHLSMLVKTTIGLSLAKHMSVRFEKLNGADVCVVSVAESHKPAYLRDGSNGGKEEFFVRVGNSTQPFSMSEAEEYIKGKWK